MEKVLENLQRIKNEIAEICNKNGRSPSEVEILAASKFREQSILKLLNKEGTVKCFGENRVQEFQAKYTPELTFDIIGRLQTNKVKYVVGKVRYIHSVDRFSLADEIERLAEKKGIKQRVFIEINTGAEEAKGGLLFDEAPVFAEKLIKDYPHIILSGVMAVAPKADTTELTKLFSRMKELYDNLRTQHQGIKVLSMGMSNDYKVAVECGSTMVRLGRVLFE